jgi:hypothetical protein
MNFSSAERFMSIPWCCYPQHIPEPEAAKDFLGTTREFFTAAACCATPPRQDRSRQRSSRNFRAVMFVGVLARFFASTVECVHLHTHHNR